ncbi:MAG: hypothetical protein IH602_08375 [Bryobacteraceae bacterium]|nr:hypothetical protein [Bryobacteraceae bacterium]
MNLLFSLVVVPLLLSALPGAPQDPSARPRVVVDPSSNPGETRFTSAVDGCEITWTVFESPANRGVVRHRSDCSIPLSAAKPAIAALLQRILQHNAGAREFRTLSWGRLLGDEARDPTMAERLSVAALRSDGWNRATGRPRGGDINGWVKTLAESAAIHDVLRAAFNAAGLRLEIASVEKVLVLKASDLPFFPRLKAAGAGPSDKVPFDCQIWFSVRRTDGLGPSEARR